jgi:hypothetical protein
MKARSDGLLIIFGLVLCTLMRQSRLQDPFLGWHLTNRLVTNKARTNPMIQNFRWYSHDVSFQHNFLSRAVLFASSASPFANDVMGQNVVPRGINRGSPPNLTFQPLSLVTISSSCDFQVPSLLTHKSLPRHPSRCPSYSSLMILYATSSEPGGDSRSGRQNVQHMSH